MKRPSPLCCALLAALALMSGCNVIPAAQSDPTRFYVLTGAPESAPAANGNVPTGHLHVGLRTVELAQYLRGAEIVVRSGSNEVQMQEYARWGEPLQAGITRVLREQLAVAPAIADVQVQPFSLSSERNFDVTITVLHCEGEGRAARFEAVIQISTGSIQPTPVKRRIFTAPVRRWDGHDFGELAAALSQDVSDLAREIIAALPDSKTG